MDHIIHTQLLDISISNVSKASEIQQSLSDHFWSEVLPEINKLFDELSKDNEVLVIELLEIDFGKIPYKDVIKKNFNSKWVQELREQILKFILPSQGKTENPQRKLSLPQHLLEQWIFYMINGYLPWSINQLPNQWEIQILEQLASDYNSIQLFKKAAYSNARMIIRIIRQHDESFLVSLLETIVAESQKQLIEIINDLTQAISAIASSTNLLQPQKFIIKESIWSLLFERSIAQPEEIKTYIWIPLFLKRATELKWIDIREDISGYKDLQQIIDRLNISIESKKAIHVKVNNLVKSAGQNSAEDESIHNSPLVLKSKKIQDNSEKLKARSSEQLKNNQIRNIAQNQQQDLNDTDEKEFYFSHVGLILLHPFIILLFKRLGFTEAGQFVSHESRLKAIYLLHYITTGSIEAKEFELAIPKLFCGELLTNVLDPCPQFETKELDEAETMLEGSIAQWKPGLFSISALRHNFLQRSGFWKTKNDQVILQLEKSSIDIILKTYPVPWNLSIVKFPWLKKLIVVEWV